MVLQYEEFGKLKGGHDNGIAKVVFSPAGTYLATAGLDGKVCIWDLRSSRLLYVFGGTSPALSLVWMPPAEDTLLCGLQDGNLAVLTIAPTSISVFGIWAHAFPVECLAVNVHDQRVASGAHKELMVWDWDAHHSKLSLNHDVGELPKRAPGFPSEVIVTSLHWTSSVNHPNLLLATYMHHGLVLLDVNTWTRIRTITLHGHIANASLSSDGARLAVSNVSRGFDVYSMRSGAPLCSLDHETGPTFPKPVLFVHGSLAIVGGSTSGELHVWDVMDTATQGPVLDVPEGDESRPRVMHILQVPRRAKVLAVDAYYNEEADEFFITAGTMSERSEPISLVWKAVEHGRVDILGGTEDVVGTSVNQSWSVFRLKYLVLGLTLIVIAIAYPLELYMDTFGL